MGSSMSRRKEEFDRMTDDYNYSLGSTIGCVIGSIVIFILTLLIIYFV